RDGLQSPSVTDPQLDEKIRILHFMHAIGVDNADIGLPGAGSHVQRTVERLAREIVDNKLTVYPSAAGRTHENDVRPIIDISQRVGHATPWGARNLIRFVVALRDRLNPDVKVDWHGHSDRGLGVLNSIAALDAGADRVHGSAGGIGERVGNTPIDLLMVNLKLMGWIENDLTQLADYVKFVAKGVHITLPAAYPVFGHDAFRTGTGVHAAAIIKAKKKVDEWLADRVYSGVPAGMFGLHQIIEVGPMCGLSNVVYWLSSHGYPQEEALAQEIFNL